MPEIKSTYAKNTPDTPTDFPVQHQDKQPGSQKQMNPVPSVENPDCHGSNRLQGRVAVITGGDSGIGQAVAAAFAKEGADIAIAFLEEREDAEQTVHMVQSCGKTCMTIACDLRKEEEAFRTVDMVMQKFGHIDILVNNIAVQFPQSSITQITKEQLRNTFETNFFSYVYMTKAVLPHLKEGTSIINTTSITAYQGSPELIDYSATKGAIVSFTRSLSLSLAPAGIRVNAVAPGPVWTPLIPSSFDGEKVAKFGQNVPLGRSAQPFELAPSYVFLAGDESAFMTGQVLHVNGGEITGS